MKKALFLGLVICLGCSVLLSAGCTKKSASAKEAIQNSQTFKTAQGKVNYLVSQAEVFYNSKEFQQAIEAAQYVLNNLDKKSQAAKNVLEKAKVQLQAVMQKAMSDASKKLRGK